MALLTMEQARKWEELVGKPFVRKSPPGWPGERRDDRKPEGKGSKP